jgi:MFS family permease
MPDRAPRRTLIVACLAHALHDGYTDSLYVLLPVWQAEFGLGYAGLAVVRGLYYGVMAGAQVPVDHAVGRAGPRANLVAGTAVAAGGYAIAGATHSLAGLCVGLVVCGLGSSVQHPQGSRAVAEAYGAKSRGPLGTYNFAGDLGKAAVPAAASLLLVALPWRSVAWSLGGLGAAVAAVVALAMPTMIAPPVDARSTDRGGNRGGFSLLLAVGMLDTAARMGYLLFLPFLLRRQGGGGPTTGIGLALLFAGGAAGKFACGWLGGWFGLLGTVAVTEAATAALILATIRTPLPVTMCLLPLLGVVLNGTSSVLYGAVPDLAKPGAAGRAFALFYTGVIGAGALAPVAYGALGDHAGQTVALVASALTALATLPLAVAVTARMRRVT